MTGAGLWLSNQLGAKATLLHSARFGTVAHPRCQPACKVAPGIHWVLPAWLYRAEETLESHLVR